MKLRIFALLSFVVISGNLHAQKKWPSTLLWKISGNGLQKDSYLFGSMHLQDKRLFHFPDSLYHFMEKADGFAMEVDINEMIDSLILRAFNNRKREKAGEDADVDKDTLAAAGDEGLPPPPDTDLTPVGKKRTKRTLSRAKNTKEEMPTIMDAWLYNVARRQGKWVGAIEDVQDQMSLLDEFGTSISDSKTGEENTVSLVVLEMMVNYYLKKDLNAIEKWIINREDDFEMLRRNQKMARRMDSLANIRSVFFTVGAAHLPGDSGVIQLLRRKGFRVEPVITTKTINPDTYLRNLPPAKWITFKDGRGFYDIEIPGSPTEINENGFEGHIYFDLSNMTFYLSSAIPAYLGLSLDTLAERFRENTDGELLSSKKITYKSLQGIEAVMSTDDAHYTLRLLQDNGVLYMLIAGGVDSSADISQESARYFNSFNPRQANNSKPEKSDWVHFAPPGKGFEMKFPGTPRRNKKSEQAAEGSNWAFHVYDYYDTKRQGYFFVNVRDIEPGYHMTEDSLFFAEIESNATGFLTEISEKKSGTFQGYPSYFVKGVNKELGATYAFFIVTRGNRVYQLLAGASSEVANLDTLISEFFGHFKLVDYEPASYPLQNAPALSFQANGPSPFKVFTDTTAGSQKTQHYVSFDHTRRISYEVFTEAISPYAWASTDSAFLEERGRQYIAETDSVLAKKVTVNGKIPAMHWHIQKPGSNLQLNMRVVAVKDTVYTLLAFAESQAISVTDIFFNSFLSKNTTRSNVTASKTALLLKDIQSKDSATFQDARAALETASFEKKDLPTLHKYLLNKYPDDTLNHFWSVRGYLVNHAAKLLDNSSIRFVKEQYPRLSTEPRLQYSLISLLSRITTKESYQLLGSILSKNPPAEIENYYLNISWYDSLELSRILYPDIFKQLENPLLTDGIMDLTEHLLDEDYLSPSDLAPFHQQLLAIGRRKAESARIQDAEDFGFYEAQASLRIMAVAEDTTLNNVLKDFLAANNTGIKMMAALAMLEKKMEVPSAIWDSIAADTYYRRDLHDSLTARKQLSLFPARFLSQELLAESDMYNYASDDYRPGKVELLEERELDIDGVKKRVYIFKVIYTYDNEEGEGMGQEIYLGMIGTFNLDKNDVTNEKFLGSLYDLRDESEISLEEQIDEMIAEALGER